MRKPSAGILWAVTAAYAILLAIGSLLPSGSDVLGGWDAAISPTLQNALHAPAYTGLVILGSLAWGRPSLGRLALIALACVALGALLEFAQAWIPGRTASLTDGLANTGGAVVGCLAMGVWGWVRRPETAPVGTGATVQGPRGPEVR